MAVPGVEPRRPHRGLFRLTVVLRKTPSLPSDQSDKLARPHCHPPAPRGGQSVALGGAVSGTSPLRFLFFIPGIKAGAAGVRTSAPDAGEAGLPAPTGGPPPQSPRQMAPPRSCSCLSLSLPAAGAPSACPCKRPLLSLASDDGAQSEPGLWGSADSSLGSISWGPRATVSLGNRAQEVNIPMAASQARAACTAGWPPTSGRRRRHPENTRAT